MSLFGSDSDDEDDVGTGPPKGLYHFPNLISSQLQTQLCDSLSTNVFNCGSNQAMLFSSATSSAFPAFLTPLLEALPNLLQFKLPVSVYADLFATTLPRQAIFNLYLAGQGITPHVDLLRFADGIIGVSLGSAAVMEFTRNGHYHSILLKPGDLYVLSGEARYEWQHGIPAREVDNFDMAGQLVAVRRKLRMSITLRRMCHGGDVVGDAS